jgi:hypothetical protein
VDNTFGRLEAYYARVAARLNAGGIS